MKKTDAYSLDARLVETIISESARLGISKSQLVETVLANGLRTAILNYEKVKNKKRVK